MVLSTVCKYILKKYSNVYSKANIQDRISAFKEKILRKTGIAKIRDRLAGVQPEQQEGPAPEEVPQEQPQSDVEALKRKRGGRKQKQVQPVAEAQE